MKYHSFSRLDQSGSKKKARGWGEPVEHRNLSGLGSGAAKYSVVWEE